MNLRYSGKVSEAGEISLPKRMRKEIAQMFAGKPIEIIVKRKRKQRSTEQNAYYWGVVVPIVLGGFIELGNDLQEGNPEHHDLVHEFLKTKFLTNGLDIVDAAGEVHKTGNSTKRLTTSEMMDYIAQVQRWSAEYLNVTIPDPNEQTELW